MASPVRLVVSMAVLLLLLGAQAVAQPIVYPDAPRLDVADDFHGIRVADPYRWLEEPNSDESQRWIRAQQTITENFLSSLEARDAYRERLAELLDYPRYQAPARHADFYVFRLNDGLQNQAVLYRQESLDAEPEVLLDPNALSDDGTVAVTSTAFSKDGRFMVYGIAEAGSDWQTFRVLDVEAKQDLPGELRWIKFSGASWLKDGSGFFYSRYEAPEEGRAYEAANEGQQLYFHRLGTSQAEDVLIHERPDNPQLGINGGVTDDGDFLVVYLSRGTDPHNEIYVARIGDLDLAADTPTVQPFLTGFDASYAPIGNDGSVFYVLTSHEAANRRLVAIDVDNPDPSAWVELIPESDAVISSVRMVNDRFIVTAMEDVKGRLTIHSKDGRLERKVEMPAIGSVGVSTGNRDDDELFYTFTSFTYPTTIYRYDFKSGESTVFNAPEVPFGPSDFVVEQVFYESSDGTPIPMFIVHRKGLQRDGLNPTYLYGYGGFNVSMTPSFSPTTISWVERGGIYAIPNLRGGGEYGREWHHAGRLEHKQNVFDDFIAAAEYLIEEGYTSSQHLGIGGGSNGGLLVGAAMTQRPELFGAAIPAVGVLDMLRYHLFTIGWAWMPEYGDPDDPEMFEILHGYSPLHNLQEGTAYPATLVMTADHDDRVVPAHSFKFAAALQHAHGGDAPVLIRIEERAGHGAGTPTHMIIARSADQWAFLEAMLRNSDS